MKRLVILKQQRKKTSITGEKYLKKATSKFTDEFKTGQTKSKTKQRLKTLTL